MACGLPVVTHPCEGLRDNAQLELVDHGVTGLIATSVEDYATAVKYLFTHPDEARKMGQAGYEKPLVSSEPKLLPDSLKTFITNS